MTGKLGSMAAMTVRRSERGFTLIELMVVVALIGILSMIAGPSLLSSVRKGRLAESMRILYSGFVDAQAKARSTGRPHRLVLDKADRKYTIETANAGGAWETVVTKTLPHDHVAFRDGGYAAAFPAPYQGVANGSWCTVCGDESPYFLEFNGEGYVSSTSGEGTTGSIALYDSTGSTSTIEALVFIGRTGDVRLFRR